MHLKSGWKNRLYLKKVSSFGPNLWNSALVLNQNPFISCDWGTSSLRVRWVGPHLAIHHEFKDSIGCKALFQSAPSRPERAAVFEAHLRKILLKFDFPAAAKVPLFISGMASSTIGWREIPYLREPLRLDGSNLRSERMDWDSPPWVGQTILISGVAFEDDMMRGEETEALGILSVLPPEDTLLILPGTHSKHLRIAGGELKGVRTYLTGELFEVLAAHSILAATVGRSNTSEAGPGFEEGVRWAREAGLPAALFRARTRGVLHHHEPEDNAAFLSGILIGAELSTLTTCDEKIWIAGAGGFNRLYARALGALDFPSHRWSCVPPEIINLAVPRGQAMLLQRLMIS